MSELLKNSVFFIYLLGALAIINYNTFERKQKLTILYVCSYGLTFNKEMRCYKIIALLIIILFLYEEYLDEDIEKVKCVTAITHKFKDFIYMYVFQYKILYIILSIGVHSQFFENYVETRLGKSLFGVIPTGIVLMLLSLIILVAGIHKIFTNLVEFKNFKQIKQQLQIHPYYILPLRDTEKREILCEKLEMVAEIEDYTFFRREKSYSCLSDEFIKIVREKREKNRKIYKKVCWFGALWNLLKTKVMTIQIERVLKTDGKRYILKRIIQRAWGKLKYEIDLLIIRCKAKARRYLRGYSTIEMQLIRILAYQKGLKFGKPKNFSDVYLIITRKLFEVIYAPIFFAGYKKELNIPKERDYYRYYLVYIYLHTVQTNLNGTIYAPLDKIFGDKDVISWPKEALFVIILGLSNKRITHERVEMYRHVMEKYKLNVEKVHELTTCIL